MAYPADVQTLWNILLKLLNQPTEMDGDGLHHPIEVSLVNGTTDVTLPVDEETGVLIVIDDIHSIVHKGKMFHAEISASILNNNSQDITFVTGANELHWTAGIQAGGSVQIFLYEGVTSTGGTPLTAFNMDRTNVSEPSPYTSIVTGATNTLGAAPIIIPGRLLAGGTTAGTRIGGALNTNTEFKLKPATKYLFRVTNISGATVVVNSYMEGYNE